MEQRQLYGSHHGAAFPTTYTREQIAENYKRHQRGDFEGREVEWARLENDMIKAAREGRVAGGEPLAKNFADGR